MLSINLFVLREKNRYCMTKGLVNPDVVEKEETLFTNMGVNEQKTRPCISLSLSLPDSQKCFICALFHQHTFIYHIMHLLTLGMKRRESGRTGQLRAVALCRDVSHIQRRERMLSVYSEGICNFFGFLKLKKSIRKTTKKKNNKER